MTILSLSVSSHPFPLSCVSTQSELLIRIISGMIYISSDKYKSDITVSQDLIIGYVKDGIMYEGEVFDELSGKYSFSPDEKGEYFFYLLSGSSDYLSLKSGNLEVN